MFSPLKNLIVFGDMSLRYTSLLLGRQATNKQTSVPRVGHDGRSHEWTFCKNENGKSMKKGLQADSRCSTSNNGGGGGGDGGGGGADAECDIYHHLHQIFSNNHSSNYRKQ